jgi:thiamine biosynthesis lipoprotein
MEYYQFRAMNTSVELAAEPWTDRLSHKPDAINESFHRAEEAVRRYEQQFSRFIETSELSQFNQSAGEWFFASAQFFEVMRLAQVYYEKTGGLFNPAILKTLEASGYDRSMDEIRAKGPGASGDNERAYAVPDFQRVEFDDERSALRLPVGMAIDLGGIAKGWIAEQAAHQMSQLVKACGVNAGGDLFTIGIPEGQTGWQIGLEDPFHPERDLAQLIVEPGAVATSSVMKRRWSRDDREYHHLIDPRTGQPAQETWVSVTVIAAHAARAEALAKALLIAGPEAAQGIIRNYPDLKFVAVDRNGQLWGTETSKRVFYGNVESKV